MPTARGAPGPNRKRFQAALLAGVRGLGGDRAAEEASGVSKSVWYDAKTGRALPDGRATWPAMRTALERLPPAKTGVRNWDALYQAACTEAGRGNWSQARPSAANRAEPSSAAVPWQLPPGTRGFAAREAELGWLNRAVIEGEPSAPPIAVVVGVPGVGKTALALHWAHRVRADFPDGILYADLQGWGPGPEVTVAELLPGWLWAFGMDTAAMPDDVRSRAAIFRSAVDGKRLLMVLDNAGDEEQVRLLLPGTASSAVVITGRGNMPGLAMHHGAQTLRLDLLPPTGARELLRSIESERPKDAEGTRDRLADLCGRLPLALRIVAEIAGSRPGTSLESLVASLAEEGERLDRLEAGTDRSDPRTVFSWSYHQLPATLATTFRRLALLPGRDFDAYAVAVVIESTPREAGRRLRELERLHLLRSVSSDRFELHDLLRLYAADRLAETEPPRAVELLRSSSFHYYLHGAAKAEELIAPRRHRFPIPGDEPVTPPLRGYHDALNWMSTEMGGITALCRQDDPALDGLRWRLAYQLRSYFFLVKRVHEWADTHRHALAAAIRCDDILGEAITRNNLGVALHEQGDDDAALSHYEAAQRLFDKVGDLHGRSNALVNQAVIFRRRGKLNRALHLNEQALMFYRGADEQRYIAIALGSVALVETAMCRYNAAELHLREAIGICDELGMHMNAARSHNALGQVLIRQGRADESVEVFQSAIKSALGGDSLFEEAIANRGLGTAFAAMGGATAARSHLGKALNLLTAIGSDKITLVRAELDELDPGDEATD